MDSSDKTNAPKFRGWVVRAALSGIVLALIFSFLPLSDVLATARRVDASLWLASLAIFWVGHVISAAKWQLLADSGAESGVWQKDDTKPKKRTLSLPADSPCYLRLPNNCPWP